MKKLKQKKENRILFKEDGFAYIAQYIIILIAFGLPLISVFLKIFPNAFEDFYIKIITFIALPYP